jgi:hypothetical protein
MTKTAVSGVAAFMVAAVIGFPALAAEAQDREIDVAICARPRHGEC